VQGIGVSSLYQAFDAFKRQHQAKRYADFQQVFLTLRRLDKLSRDMPQQGVERHYGQGLISLPDALVGSARRFGLFGNSADRIVAAKPTRSGPKLKSLCACRGHGLAASQDRRRRYERNSLACGNGGLSDDGR
jgi:hypothetical protein